MRFMILLFWFVFLALSPARADMVCSNAGCFERHDYYSQRYYEEHRDREVDRDRYRRHRYQYEFDDPQPRERHCYMIEGVRVCR